MARKPKNTPSIEQKAYFYERVKYHQDRLNLKNWRVERSPLPAIPGCYASVSVSSEDHMATVAIGEDWKKTDITNEELDSTALHEVLHVFLAPYKTACMARDESRIGEEEHSVITILEKLFMERTS